MRTLLYLLPTSPSPEDSVAEDAVTTTGLASSAEGPGPLLAHVTVNELFSVTCPAKLMDLLLHQIGTRLCVGDGQRKSWTLEKKYLNNLRLQFSFYWPATLYCEMFSINVEGAVGILIHPDNQLPLRCSTQSQISRSLRSQLVNN